MQKYTTSTNPNFPLFASSVSLATIGLPLLLNAKWAISTMFISSITAIGYPLAAFLGLANIALAFYIFQAFNSNDLQRKRDALLVNTMLFFLSAVINLRCYSPFVVPMYSLIVGEGRVFLWKALFDACLAGWSYFSCHSFRELPAARKVPVGSQ